MALTTAQKAPILDENGVQLDKDHYVVSSSNPAIASIDWQTGPVFVAGEAPGTVTLTATRNSTGAQATLSVEVDGLPFSISLGAAVAK